jgi:hypothetical protein
VAEERTERPRDARGSLPKEQVDGGGDAGPEADAGAPRADDEAATGAEPSEDRHTETIDISDTVAPSVGPHTHFTRSVHEEGPAEHGPSDVDAMGLDKRREVFGQSYGPSFAKQATLYGAFLAVVAALVIGGKILADKLDQPPDTVEPKAPWAASDAPQHSPPPLDFPRYGGIPTNTESGP